MTLEVTIGIETPRVFVPLRKPARYKAAFGGRGSGKSHAFAERLILRAVREPGLRAVTLSFKRVGQAPGQAREQREQHRGHEG